MNKDYTIKDIQYTLHEDGTMMIDVYLVPNKPISFIFVPIKIV